MLVNRGELALCASRSSSPWPRTRRLRQARPRAALPDEDAPGEKRDALQAATRAPGPAEVIVWGGNLPSPRRAALGGLGALAITLLGNLGGVTSQLLSSSPENARALRLDALFPVAGLKRVVSTSAGYELLIPDTWLADQTIARRRAALAELERGPLDPPSLRAASVRRSALPDSAYGPPGSTGEENISVIVENANAFGMRFTLASMGAARDVAERLLANVIARPGSGKTATLVDVQESQSDSTGLPVYLLEFIVRSVSARESYPALLVLRADVRAIFILPPQEKPAFERHNLSVLYGDAGGRLFTYTAQVPQADWVAQEARLRECVASFRVWS